MPHTVEDKLGLQVAAAAGEVGGGGGGGARGRLTQGLGFKGSMGFGVQGREKPSMD